MSQATAIPETSDELAELLNDGGKVADLIKTGQFADVIKAYAKAQAEAANGDLPRQVKTAMQEGWAEFIKGSRDPGANAGPAVPAAFGGGGMKAPGGLSAKQVQMAAKQKLWRPQAIGAPLDGSEHAASWGKFLAATWYRNERRAEFDEFKGQIRNAMAERVPSEGGFLVPEVLRSEILMLALESAVVRPRARIIPMDSLRVPYPTIDDPSHVSSVYGGVVGYWTEEGGQLEISQPAFGRIILEAKKLTGYTEIPNELLADAIAALDQFFTEMFPEALVFFEDYAFINGSGVGEPRGILNASCAVSVDRVTSNDVQFGDIAAMFPRMLPQSLNRAVWLCSPDVIGQLLQLVLISGSTPVAPPLWLTAVNGESSATAGVSYNLLGRPLIVSEKLPALGATGDLTFVDFGYYLLGDRQSMQVSNSEHYKFANDLTAFRVIERVDGQPWLRSALTPANGSSNTLSPIVTLNTTQAS